MKKLNYLSTTAILIASILLIACATPHKQTYEFPAEMIESVRADYTRQWEKGHVLYNLTCARCHTQGKGGNTRLPSFTSEQLQAYYVRGANAAHETTISEERVNTEELGYIVTFLQYRKKTNRNSYLVETKEKHN